ncbi:hypothetical protein SDC9_60597 [bioreactor metagenome]|uniref:Uncharacterized protein n=1 Tax=bioreactor metagenome TaxID=1076179 RepID=A0A644XDC7_9ZZZZ
MEGHLCFSWRNFSQPPLRLIISVFLSITPSLAPEQPKRAEGGGEAGEDGLGGGHLQARAEQFAEHLAVVGGHSQVGVVVNFTQFLFFFRTAGAGLI